MPIDQVLLAAAMGNVKPETFMAHWREIQDAKEASHDAAAVVARAKKAAKRDGIDLDALALVEKMAAFPDADERAAHWRKVIVYSDWAKCPLAAFAETLAAPIPQASTARTEDFEVWQAEQDGMAAGKGGRPEDTNPKDAGSAHYVAWNKGWKAGFKKAQRKIAAGMVKGADVAAATGKRGRGNGEAAAAA